MDGPNYWSFLLCIMHHIVGLVLGLTARAEYMFVCQREKIAEAL